MNIVRVIYKSLIFLSLFILIFLFWNPSPVLAHRPHDVIEQVELSPNYSQDKTLYIIVREQFLKSTDGGKSWQRVVNGIDNKSYFNSLSLSHQNNKILFLSSLEDGIYKTENGGDSWIKVNNGLTNPRLDQVMISPVSDEIVLASGDNVLYLTVDGGKNWQYTTQAADTITAIGFSPTQKDSFVIGDRQGHLYSTLDGGKSWKEMAMVANRDPANKPNGNAITTLALSSDQTVLIGTNNQGIFRTTLQGGTIQESDRGLSDPKIRDIAFSPNYAQDSLIFASTWDEGAFKSDNGGKNWQKFSQGLTKDEQADVPQYSVPHFQDIRLSTNFTQDRTIFLAGFNGLFLSTNGGQQWRELETLSTRAIVALDISPNHAKDSTVAVGTYEQEAYISHDRAETWQSMLNGLSVLKYNPVSTKPNSSSSSDGIVTQNSEKKNVWEIEPPRFYDLLFSPNYASNRTIFASLLYKFALTTDGGQTWNRTPFPVAEENTGNTRDVSIVASPNYAQDKIVYAVTKYDGEVYQSNNGGRKFSIIGKIDNLMTGLDISPNFATDRTLFAATLQGGIYRSIDLGQNWQNVTLNSEFTNYHWINLAISSNYQVDRTIFAGTNHGIILSRDGGVTWKKLETTPHGTEAFIEVFAISPNYKNDRTYIAGVRGHGLFKTTDGGQTFRQIGKDLIEKNYPFSRMVMSASIPLQFSPTYAQDNTLYGFGSTRAEIYRSTNGGETWDVLMIPRQFDLKASFFDHLKLVKLFFRVYPGLKFVVGTVGALFTYFLLGTLNLGKWLPLRRWQFRIGGSLLTFIALWLLLSD